MYEREMSNRDNNDTVVTIPPPVATKGDRTEEYRSRVRRDGTSYLEIEIPRRGITSAADFVGFLTLAFTFLLIGLPLAPAKILLNGVDDLPFLLFIAVPALFILCIPSIAMESFTQTNVTITRDGYCLTRRSITWKSLFQIMFIPSHFNDFESRQFVEAIPKQSHHSRHGTLRAQIVTEYRDHSLSRDIELGSISFAAGLGDEELCWLAEEINCFLQQT